MVSSRRASFSAASLAALEDSFAPRSRALSNCSTDTEDWDDDGQSSQGAPSGSTGTDLDSEAEDERPPPLRLSLTDSTVPSRVGSFDLVAEYTLSSAPITVSKWVSQKTGLSVVYANTPGPIINLWATVRTEIFDDSGRPHTLEHLTFMGSKKYPYKGILDICANRCLANGTNAWTAVDNTTYTASTASEEGMLTLLPVYLDHIYNPTMKDSAFTTEVFNVNSEGNEGGVVYSEMQARSGSSDDLLELRLQQILYDHRNGYRSETGGMLDALRHLHLKDIKTYHAQAYTPQNTTLVLTGQALHPLRLLTTLVSSVEPNLPSHGPHPRGWKRPFLETSTASNPPQLYQDETDVVEYPEKDESVGEVQLHWIGPPARDYELAAALAVLGDYLSGSSISPLNKLFVENKDPAASDISFTSDFRDPTILHCLMSSVPAAKLHTLGPSVLKALADLVRLPFDLTRMHTVLHQSKLATLSVLEGAPGTWIQGNVMEDLLYGPEDGSRLAETMKDVEIIKKLLRWSATEWIALIDDYYVIPHSVTLIGKPSATLAHRKALADAARVEETKRQLGPAGLALQGKKIAQAQAENATPIPPKLVKSFKIPSLKKIGWLKVETARARGVSKTGKPFRNRVQDHVDGDRGEPPLFIQFDHIASNFIEITLVMHGSAHPLLSLYLDSFFSLPLNRADGQHLSHEDVARELDQDSLWRSIGTLGEGVALTMKVERSKYPVAVAWIRDLLYGSVFDVDRLVNSVVTTLQNLPSAREDDASVASAGHQQLILSDQSILTPMNLLYGLKTLPGLLKRLRSDPQSVVKDLEKLRHDLTDHRAFRISVKGDILRLMTPSSTWITEFEKVDSFAPSELIPVVREIDVLTPLGRRPSHKFVIYSSPSSSSTYSRHQAPGPDWRSADLPALQVAVAALNAIEGYLWTAVRGAGLAYGASIAISLETKALTYVVFKSPNAFAAFSAAKTLIDSLISGKIEITQAAVDGAKSNLAYNLVSSLHTLDEAASASFVDTVIFDRPQGYARYALDRVQDVRLADVLPAIKKWIRPIFDPEQSLGVASTGAGELPHLIESFKKWGYDVEHKTT